MINIINGGLCVDTNELIHVIAEACDDKQAEEIIILNMKEVSLIADYFLICHANNQRQIQTIAHAVRDAVEKEGITVNYMEGYEQARWIVIDTGYVLCHIFHVDERRFYNLERLWGDATRVPLQIGQEG